MSLQVLTLDDFELEGKTVLLRVDINSPLDRQTKAIKDDTRIRRCLPTIRELADRGARVVILAHQGDPLDYENFTPLAQHAELLSRLMGRPVAYLDDVAGPAARQRIRGLQKGQILLLENVRIHTEETIIFEEEVRLSPAEQAQTYVVRNLAPLADLYVCDAFAAAHRSEPTLVGFPQVLPAAAGRLFEEELRVLTQVRGQPERPCFFLLGGAKILDAFKMMRAALESGAADGVLTVGLTGEIMLIAAGYELGEATLAFLREKNLLDFVKSARELLATFGDRLHYPLDVAVVEDGERQELPGDMLPAPEMIVDVGQRTVEDYSARIAAADTIFVNGPAGIYEEEASAFGTRALWEAMAASPAFTVIGGGDSIAAAREFGVLDGFSYVCTAGGGLVRFLAGEPLPVVNALAESATRQRGGITE
ncbi:MAG: phosphoglycerate kinase [Anaerolineales bacterium]|nr:phosphoglycerate kinase [Anaerolineales bacterium]